MANTKSLWRVSMRAAAAADDDDRLEEQQPPPAQEEDSILLRAVVVVVRAVLVCWRCQRLPFSTLHDPGTEAMEVY